MKTMGIIFSNVYDSALGELTNERTVASLPFGGRYRQIDFILSNMSNSGIYNIGLITKYNYQSLMDHLGSCDEWDLNRKNERLRLIPPFAFDSTRVYRGKLEALINAKHFINNSSYDYVVMSDTTVICNLDFRPFVEQHVKSGADITLLATPGDGSDRKYHMAVKTSSDGIVTDLKVDAPAERNEYAGMGMFIISRELLAENVKYASEHGYVDFERDFIQRQYNTGKLKIAAAVYSGVVLRNDSIQSFYKNNLALLDPKVRKNLFKFYRPVYTRSHEAAPTYYKKGSSVVNTIITDGGYICGDVSDSVIFRNVTVGEGTKIRSSVIMKGAKIGKNADIEYVILDKNVTVGDGVSIKGTPDYPVVIKKGSVL